MTPPSWKGGLLVAGTMTAAGVVWLLQTRHAASPPRLVVPPASVPAVSQGMASPAVPSAVRLSPPAAAFSKAQTRKERWEKSFPGGPLPYALSGIGPKPGPPTQKIAGFTVTAQATDAPALQPGEKPTLTTLLTASAASLPGKNRSWELNQNGLSAEGDPETGGSVAGAGFQPRGTGQVAAITQTPQSRGRHPKVLILRGVLRQSEDYEEPLTFQTPETTDGAGSKFQSQQTPSGIKVTLPPQGLLASGGSSGDSTVLRLCFQIEPNAAPITLPQSPLFQKYHKPVLVRVGAMNPNGGSYDYPFSDPNPQGWMSIYKQPNQHWQYGTDPSVLNLVVQQRIYTREIPFAMRVPVTHKPFSEYGGH